MARLPIILIFMIWLSWSPSGQAAGDAAPSIANLGLCTGALAAGIFGMGLYSRMMSRRLSGVRFHRDLRRFNKTMRIAQFVVPGWFAALVYLLGYPVFVYGLLGSVQRWPLEAPALVLGILPAMLAWVGLWWASYPAERALREQGMMILVDRAAPVRCGPTLWQYLVTNVRLQLLFMLAPVLCILTLRDLFAGGARLAGIDPTDTWQIGISLAAMLPVMLLSPLILIRILPTTPLPDSPLRQRLEELCRRHGLKVADILLWQTGSNIGNAAVMGLLPRVRYLLVTDLLLETMPDEQILAVFAHEIGHVVHRHLLWMVACGFAVMFTVGGPVEMGLKAIEERFSITEPYSSLAVLGVTAPLFFLVFGWVVRRFERQADVFAARTIPQVVLPDIAAEAPTGRNVVHDYGASLVCGALQQIAMINNVPINAHEWLHGSIGWRMGFLRGIADAPEKSRTFDRNMRWLYVAIAVVTLVMGLWTAWNGVGA